MNLRLLVGILLGLATEPVRQVVGVSPSYLDCQQREDKGNKEIWNRCNETRQLLAARGPKEDDDAYSQQDDHRRDGQRDVETEASFMPEF